MQNKKFKNFIISPFVKALRSSQRLAGGILALLLCASPAFAALSVEYGTFTKSTGGAPVEQTITVGFQPKALIMWTTAQTSAGNTDEEIFGLGFSDGSSERAIGISSQDAQGSSDASRTMADAKALSLIELGTTTIIAECDVTFTSTEFKLNWTTNDSNAYIIHYLVIGGSDITNVAVGNFSDGASSGNRSVTGLGFQPDFVMNFSHDLSSFSVANNAPMGLGAAVSSSQRGSIGITSEHNRGTSDTWHFNFEGFISTVDDNTGALDIKADFISMDSDGFTYNVSETAAANVFNYIAIKGGQWDVRTITLNTSTGNQTITGVGFTPVALIHFTNGDTAFQTTSTVAESRFSMGGTDGTNEGHSGFHDVDAAGTTINASRTSTTALLSSITAAATGLSSTVDEEISHVSFNSDGNVINVDTAGAAIKIFQIALGANAVGGGWTGKINGVTNPAKIDGTAVASIAKVNGN